MKKSKNIFSGLAVLLIAAVIASGCGPGGCTNTFHQSATMTASVLFGKSGNTPATTTTTTTTTTVAIPVADSLKITKQPVANADPSPLRKPADSMGTSGCNGKGICNMAAGAQPGATPVQFTFLDSEPMKLQLTFSLTDLLKNQPDQVPYFKDPSGTYRFESPYSLNTPMFQSLHLPLNSFITPNSKTTVVLSNTGQVSLKIEFAHSTTPPPTLNPDPAPQPTPAAVPAATTTATRN